MHAWATHAGIVFFAISSSLNLLLVVFLIIFMNIFVAPTKEQESVDLAFELLHNGLAFSFLSNLVNHLDFQPLLLFQLFLCLLFGIFQLLFKHLLDTVIVKVL